MGWVRRYDMNVPSERSVGLDFATTSVANGELVVLPTDTVYGLGTDAFSIDAVAALLAAKGRGRDMPVPVLVGSPGTLDGIATDLSGDARALVEGFWPGGLTLVARVAPSLQWDLGDTGGTVAVRMPLHPVALEVLRGTGPLVLTSANRVGLAPPASCPEAQAQLGDAVRIYLDAGISPETVTSSVVDLTDDVPRLLRAGSVALDLLREVCPDLQA